MGVRLLQFLNSIHVTEEKTTFNTSNQLDFTFGAVVCIRLDKGNTTQMLITIPVFLTRRLLRLCVIFSLAHSNDKKI